MSKKDLKLLKDLFGSDSEGADIDRDVEEVKQDEVEDEKEEPKKNLEEPKKNLVRRKRKPISRKDFMVENKIKEEKQKKSIPRFFLFEFTPPDKRIILNRDTSSIQ